MSASEPTASESIIFGERHVGGGRVIGLILLNRPGQINAITAHMFGEIDAQLDRWEYDERVVALGLAGAGQRGFSAGGDVVSLYHLSQEPNDETALAAAEAFFECEYRVDERLHNWAKPVIAVAHGICMGGGLGLVRAASHRVVTEDIRMAMPEVHIGFFPDVGSCSWLHGLPAGLGRLMATTGVSIHGAADAVYSGLATASLDDASLPTFWDDVGGLAWAGKPAADHEVLSEFLASKTGDAVAEAFVSTVLEPLQRLAGAPDFASFAGLLTEFALDYPFFQPGALATKAASPTSMVLADRYFELGEGRSASAVLASDAILAKRLLPTPDFGEGVRSVLVDKDNSARWSPERIDDIATESIDELLDGI